MVRALLLLLAPVAGALASAAEAPHGPPPERPVLEEVVAVVRPPASTQPRVITLTKLTEEARIALVSRGAIEAARRPLDGEALHAALEWLIDQTVLSEEAARLQIFEVDRAEAQAELRRFQARFRKDADYRGFLAESDLTEEELLAVLRRMVRVQRYLDNRLGRAGRVPEAEVEAYFRAHEADFSGRGLPAVRDAIRAHLAEERLRAETKALLADLRARSEIRILDPVMKAGG